MYRFKNYECNDALASSRNATFRRNICVLIGMRIHLQLESNFAVHLEDTPSPPKCSWESIADDVIELLSQFLSRSLLLFR